MLDNILNNIKKFAQFDEEELHAFSMILKEKYLPKGEHFLKEGQVSNEIGYINEGLLMHYKNHDGEIIPADFAVEDEWIAYLKSFSTQTPSDMNISALEDSKIIVLNASDLATLFKNYPKFMVIKNHQVEKALIESTQHAESLSTLTSKERYDNFIKQKPNLIKRVPQYYLAAYLGMKPQSLSRIRKSV